MLLVEKKSTLIWLKYAVCHSQEEFFHYYLWIRERVYQEVDNSTLPLLWGNLCAEKWNSTEKRQHTMKELWFNSMHYLIKMAQGVRHALNQCNECAQYSWFASAQLLNVSVLIPVTTFCLGIFSYCPCNLISLPGIPHHRAMKPHGHLLQIRSETVLVTQGWSMWFMNVFADHFK